MREGSGPGRCAIYGEEKASRTLRILLLSAPSFSDSLKLPICNMFNSCELLCRQGWREDISGERRRVSRKEKAFTAPPADTSLSKGAGPGEMRLAKRKQ